MRTRIAASPAAAAFAALALGSDVCYNCAMKNIVEISEFTAPELDVYARLTEAQLLHCYEPKGGLFIAESPKVIDRALDAGYDPVSMLTERRHIEGEARGVIARCLEIHEDMPVFTGETDMLAQLTGFKLTRGVLCAMRRKPVPSAEEVCSGARRIAVLEDTMNPANLGSVFRSAAALGMDAVLLTPGCCDPLYRRAVRVSMGTVFQIPWAYIGKSTADWPEDGMRRLRAMDFTTAAMSLREDSISIDDKRLPGIEKLAIVLGTEGDGLRTETTASCDYRVKIPMYHEVDSLNVAAASAVAFWALSGKMDSE